MPRPRLRLPKKAAPKVGGKMKNRLPDKVGKVKPIYNANGLLLMRGTEAEWRKWVKTRR